MIQPVTKTINIPILEEQQLISKITDVFRDINSDLCKKKDKKTLNDIVLKYLINDAVAGGFMQVFLSKFPLDEESLLAYNHKDNETRKKKLI